MPNIQISVLNGPNLHKLGSRQPNLYGHETLKDAENMCRFFVSDYERTQNGHGKPVKNIDLTFKQTNHEGILIDWIHEAAQGHGLIINGAALSHTSIGIMDALGCLSIPIYEVHISQIYKREPFRHHSYISHAASGIIIGCGIYGYVMALQALLKRDLEKKNIFL